MDSQVGRQHDSAAGYGHSLRRQERGIGDENWAVSPPKRHLGAGLVWLLLGIAMLFISLTAAYSSYDSPNIVEIPLSNPRNSHTLNRLADNLALVTGGWDGNQPLADSEIYASGSNSWQTASPMNEARSYHRASELFHGAVLVTGGRSILGVALASSELYDPGSDVWSAAASLNVGRAGHTSTTLQDGRVLVTGGWGSAGIVAEIEIYDPTSNTWGLAGKLAVPRVHHTATLLPSGEVLIVGGLNSANEPLSDVELFDPKTGQLASIAPLTIARLDHTATPLADGTILVAGGYNSQYLISAELYDPVKNVWSAAGDMLEARAYHAAARLDTGEVLVAGGSDGVEARDTFELYEPASKTWTLSSPLQAAYEAPEVIWLKDRILIAGYAEDLRSKAVETNPSPTNDIAAGVSLPGTPRPPKPTVQAYLQGANTVDGAVVDVSGAARDGALVLEVATPLGNYTEGDGTARLYGVHEVSFVLTPTPAANPYARNVIVRFNLPAPTASAISETITVTAFYDGTPGGLATWRARVYVNRIGQWTWQARDNDTPVSVANTAFAAIEESAANLHGMLRVSSEAKSTISAATYIGDVVERTATRVASPKRWYTDDGHTFLPIADTAYRLFFDTPQGQVPTICPPVRSAEAALTFVRNYAADYARHGVNVLRVEALGTWAYADRKVPATPELKEYETDLSLFWSVTQDGQAENLFNAAPSVAALATPSATFYPNLKSFQNVDAKLKHLLEKQPELYIQMLLVPEPSHTYHDHEWLDATSHIPPTPSIAEGFREQMWQTMVARWAAFPNVFWSISNDLGDTDQYPNNLALAEEIGDYIANHDPWFQDANQRLSRPLSMGHLRNARDASIAKSWHTYITAYSDADISAQQMDGATPVPQATPLFYATAEAKPVFNAEDRYEGVKSDNYKAIENPDDFFNRIFWSYLLSGSGATYGSELTWPGRATYTDTTTYLAYPHQPPPVLTVFPLEGLNKVKAIPTVLADARVDLSRFRPADSVFATPTGAAAWAEINRIQVAVRENKEILAYAPNPDLGVLTPSANSTARSLVRASAGTPLPIHLDFSKFTDANYAVTWYDADGGIHPAATIPGNPGPTPGPTATRVVLTPPAGVVGDAVVHISSRCQDTNKCLRMDDNPGDYVSNPKNGFRLTLGSLAATPTSFVSTMSGDSETLVAGNQSWLCQRPKDAPQWNDDLYCLLQYAYDGWKSIVTVDYYLRRNSRSAVQGVGIAASQSASDPITDWNSLYDIWVGFNPEGDLFSEIYEEGSWKQLDVLHNVPLASNRWYHVKLEVVDVNHASAAAPSELGTPGIFDVKVFLDGALVYTTTVKFDQGDLYLRGAEVYTSWWGPLYEMDSESTPSVWWDELTIDPPPDADLHGLYRTFAQQGLGGYARTNATYFNSSGGYNSSAELHVGANNNTKTLLRFDLSPLAPNAVVDEAILELYHSGSSNGNALTLGVHEVLVDWTDTEANNVQRKSGVNWSAPGMGSGSDYAATPATTANLLGAGDAWVYLDISDVVQQWIEDPSTNMGLVLLQTSATGFVTYDFCSELGWAPCSAALAPKLTLRYHLIPPAPSKTTFQQGADSYTGNRAMYFDGSGGYNNASQVRVGADDAMKTLLRFELPGIPTGARIDEATLRLFQTARSNGNSMTIGAHRVLAEWVDAEANRTQRRSGINWNVMGMGSGSDYEAGANGTAGLASAGGAWIDLNVTAMVRDWVADPSANLGLVLTQEAASGFVYYSFCSESGWAPCNAAQAPRLTIWYH